MIDLQRIRESKGISRSDLAKQMNVGINTVWRWEKGQRIPDLETIQVLRTLLGCSLDELLGPNPTRPARGRAAS